MKAVSYSNIHEFEYFLLKSAKKVLYICRHDFNLHCTIITLEIIHSVEDFDGSTITVQLPAGGTSGDQVDLEISFVDDVINEPQETFVGFIEIEDAVDTSTIKIGTRATQLIINDNDSERTSSETSAV